MNHPAQNWKCKCGRPPSLEHGVGEYCSGRIIIEGLESERDALKQKATTLIDDKILCPDCEAPCILGKRMDGSTYLKHPVYACPKQIQEELSKTDAEIERLREALLLMDSGAREHYREGEYGWQFHLIAKAALEVGRE